MVPLSGMVRTVQQAGDSVVRRPEGWKENLDAMTPGRSTRVKPRLDRFGQPVVREGGSVKRAADPFNVSSVVEDPIADELHRLGIRLGLPTDRLTLPGGRRLSRDEEFELQREKGTAVRAQLERVMQSGRYDELSDDDRRERLEAVIDRTRRRVSSQARRRIVQRRSGPPDALDALGMR